MNTMACSLGQTFSSSLPLVSITLIQILHTMYYVPDSAKDQWASVYTNNIANSPTTHSMLRIYTFSY